MQKNDGAEISRKKLRGMIKHLPPVGRGSDSHRIQPAVFFFGGGGETQIHPGKKEINKKYLSVFGGLTKWPI